MGRERLEQREKNQGRGGCKNQAIRNIKNTKKTQMAKLRTSAASVYARFEEKKQRAEDRVEGEKNKR